MPLWRICRRFAGLSALAWLFTAGSAYPQGAAINSGAITVLSATGRPIGGALVTICAFGATGVPCSPTITVYTDPTLVTPATNPAISDGNGNVFVYAAPGSYTYTVTGPGITGKSFTATVAGSGGGNVLTSAPNTFTQLQTFNGGITTTIGPVALNSPSNALNNWSITAPGVFSGPTGPNNENFLFTVSACNPSTEYGALHTQNATDVVTGCINMAPGGFAPVANALAGYCRGNLNASCDGGYFQARCLVANCSGFGANSVAQDVAALTGIGLLGFESDVFLNNTTTTGAGISVNGNFSVQPTNFPGIIVNQPTFNGGTGKFTAGLSIPSGSTTGIAVDIGLTQSGAGNNLPSQTVRMSSRDSGGVLRSSTFGVDANGNIQLSPGASGVTCNAVNCAINASFLVNPTGTPLAIPTVGNNVVSDTATQALTNKTLNIPLSNGTGLQFFNTTTTCTTAATINTPCTTAAITLPVAEADTNYRVSCTGLGPTQFPQLQTVTKSNTTFTITLNNLTAAAATYSSFDCLVGHN